jgi:hydrogenase maturation protein HypF
MRGASMERPAPPARGEARHALRVRGVVQGVGFRPFVHRLATELRLSGFVRNDAEGVAIEVQGAGEALAIFGRRLRSEAPALSRIDAVECSVRRPVCETGFAIRASGTTGRRLTGVAPDAAVCPDCLGELFDPGDRRWRYAFINCTQCGPRYTITRALPYDRPNTSMAPFVQCPACRAEYADPASRRFHAQPNACVDCGPRLALVSGDGAPIPGADPIADAVARLRRGEILALKGLGGFHLACDARDAAAVARLRRRKDREEKPFALMAANAESLAGLAQVDAGSRALLEARERPIVLLAKAPECDAALPGVAPDSGRLGAMLPYAPLHYLLFHEAADRPAGMAWLREPQAMLLVMTSANPGGEPLVTDNAEALSRLAGIADALLMHGRDIVVRCDDSVVVPAATQEPVGGRREQRDGGPDGRCAAADIMEPRFVRRGRGYTPQAIKLPAAGPPVLATGGWLKNTVCVTRGDEAFLSQHIGDLDNATTCVAMEQTVAHLLDVLQVRPEAVAHDLHPDFHSSRFALQFAHERGVPAVAVQHHHAHIAAVLAEHGVAQALGVALDGVGLGIDGTAWGGELLRVDGTRMQRVGRLRPLQLPGGDRAAREPWRMAAAALFALGRDAAIAQRYAGRGGPTIARMLARGLNCPTTSSAGRWFDAAAGLLGVKDVASFEGQAAMLLEDLAQRHGATAPLPDSFAVRPDGTLDLLPLLARLAEPIDAAEGAALFHATLAEALAQWALAAARREGVGTVALGGGCFMNTILSTALPARLRDAGMRVLEARQAPPNDGGLALGQAWVAVSRLLQQAGDRDAGRYSSLPLWESRALLPSPLGGEGRGVRGDSSDTLTPSLPMS